MSTKSQPLRLGKIKNVVYYSFPLSLFSCFFIFFFRYRYIVNLLTTLPAFKTAFVPLFLVYSSHDVYVLLFPYNLYEYCTWGIFLWSTLVHIKNLPVHAASSNVYVRSISCFWLEWTAIQKTFCITDQHSTRISTVHLQFICSFL